MVAKVEKFGSAHTFEIGPDYQRLQFLKLAKLGKTATFAINAVTVAPSFIQNETKKKGVLNSPTFN